jgi:hypothetical protein
LRRQAPVSSSADLITGTTNWGLRGGAGPREADLVFRLRQRPHLALHFAIFSHIKMISTRPGSAQIARQLEDHLQPFDVVLGIKVQEFPLRDGLTVLRAVERRVCG